MSCSSIYLLDCKGKVLISRNYRGNIGKGVIETFMPLLIEAEENGWTSPVIKGREYTFLYIKCRNIYLVCVTKRNVNVALVFVLLHKIVDVMVDYFQKLEEESTRDNFVLIYELLDELVDFGYPQTTDHVILKEYILQKGIQIEMQPKVPLAVTNAVSWRCEGIVHKKNEVFMDVVESINMLVGSSGNILTTEVTGAIKVKSNLSGMPELRLGLNDKILFEDIESEKLTPVDFEDVRLHQCVRLSRFESDRTISFIPPDGDFDLMSYRLSKYISPLIWIESTIEKYSHSRVKYSIKATSFYKLAYCAKNVKIIIPVSADADSPVFQCTIGNVKYVGEENFMVWYIKSFAGEKEYLMKAQFWLSSFERDFVKLPIRVEFQIPYYTISGIQVRYLKIVEKSGYQALPWVRYITKNGDFQFRTKI